MLLRASKSLLRVAVPIQRLALRPTSVSTSVFAKMSSSQYATTFPAVPRKDGIAKVSFGPGATEGEITVIQFVTKEASAGGAGLAAKDAEKDPVQVTYGRVGGADARILSCSIGPAAKVDGNSLRKAASAAVSKLRSLKVTAAEVRLPAVEGIPAPKTAEIIVQAAALTNYHFDRYLTTEEKVPTFLSTLRIVPNAAAAAEEAATAAAVAATATLAEATIFARDVANERADEMHPAKMEAVARAVAAEIGAEVHVVSGDDLLTNGLHLMHAVGQSARHPARYVEIAYKGDPAHPEDVLMVVGKGICFDSGGLNIKGTGFMEDMHMDKGGASAALGCALATGRLRLKRNVVFVLAVAENAIDSLSYKPHAVIKSHKGLTVEIGNTDAEGRLVLADALSYGQSRHKPHTIIDMATLTGACIVGLGEYTAGLFSNNAALRAGLQAAAEERWERVWPMPILAEHREELKASAQADLQSTGAGRYGGACTAAAFLEYFIGHEPAKNARTAASAADGGAAAAAPSAAPAATPVAWAHLDIAGPGMYSRDRGHMKAGGTGFGVQVVTQYLLSAPAGALPADPVKKY